jgi:hypothetical protein
MPTLATTCPACASPHITITTGHLAPFVAARTGVDATLGRTCICTDCTLRFSHTRWTDQEAAALYADYRGLSYNAERDHHEPGYSQTHGHLNQPRSYLADIEAWIATYTTPASVLDIGGNDGRNTPFADRATIWEIGDPEPTGHYDLAVLAHVLEHAANPRDLVTTASNHADLIYIEVPIEPPLDTWHEHIQQYTTQSLQALLGPDATIRATTTPLGPVLQALR